MKKKILVAGLTFSLLAGAAIGFAACDDTHTHSLSSVEKKDATCTEAGYESYYKCSDCDKIFSDSKGETEISAPTAIPAAHKVTAVAQKDSTCTAEGTAAHYKCSECDTLFSDSEGKNVITSAGKLEKKAHTIEEVSKKRPSCTEAGYEAHYKCTDCETLFSDEEGKTVITEPTAIPAEHRIDEVPELKATCITAGYKAHYACSLCKELFADSEAKNKIEKPEEIPANGIHDYGFGYTSETAPVPEATGGKLQTKCIVCDKEGDEVAYEKGFSMKGKFPATAPILENSGKYYVTLETGSTVFSWIKFKVSTAGTYKVSFTGVYSDENLVRGMSGLWIQTKNYPVAPMNPLYTLDWVTAANVQASVEKYRDKVEFEGNTPGKFSTMDSITFTFTEEDLAEGELFIMISLSDKVINEDGTMVNATNGCTYLIDFEAPEPEPEPPTPETPVDPQPVDPEESEDPKELTPEA